MWGTLSVARGETVEPRSIPTEAGDYRHYYENVRNAIVGNVPLAVTPEQAIEVLRALQLAIESSATGCKIRWPETAVESST